MPHLLQVSRTADKGLRDRPAAPKSYRSGRLRNVQLSKYQPRTTTRADLLAKRIATVSRLLERPVWDRTLSFNLAPLADRFLGALARERTGRFRPITANWVGYDPQLRVETKNSNGPTAEFFGFQRLKMPRAFPRRPRRESSPVSGGRRAKVPFNSPIAKRRPAGANEAGACTATRVRRRRGQGMAQTFELSHAPFDRLRPAEAESSGRRSISAISGPARRSSPAVPRPKASSSLSRDALDSGLRPLRPISRDQLVLESRRRHRLLRLPLYGNKSAIPLAIGRIAPRPKRSSLFTIARPGIARSRY